MSQVRFRTRDYSDEYSSVNLEVSAGIATADANIVRGAVLALIRGTMGAFEIVDIEIVDAGSTARPASPEAQREDKWVITYRDTVLDKTFRKSLPTADRTLLSPGSEVLDTGSTEFINLKSALDSHMLSPYGNAVSVEAVEYVAVAL